MQFNWSQKIRFWSLKIKGFTANIVYKKKIVEMEKVSLENYHFASLVCFRHPGASSHSSVEVQSTSRPTNLLYEDSSWYLGPGTIQFKSHTSSNDFVYNKNSLSSEWVSAIKLSTISVSLTEVPPATSTFNLCRESGRERDREWDITPNVTCW